MPALARNLRQYRVAGAAAVSELAMAMHRIGVPEEKLHHLHEAIARGHYLVILRCGRDEAETWRRRLAWYGGEEAEDFDFVP